MGGTMNLRPSRARLKTAATSAPGAGALRTTAAPESPPALRPWARERVDEPDHCDGNCFPPVAARTPPLGGLALSGILIDGPDSTRARLE